MQKIAVQKAFLFGFLVICSITLFRASFAQNCGFMPGDAFFASWINEEFIESELDAHLSLREGGANREGTLGTYIGFSRLSIEGDAERLRTNLMEGMRFLRRLEPRYERIVSELQNEDGTVRSRSLNRFLCLVYPRDFNLRKIPLGLRFNENWIDAKDNSQIAEIRSRHNCEWVQREAVVRDWLYGSRVPALNVSFEAGLDFRRDRNGSDYSATVRDSDVKFVLVRADFFNAAFNDFLESLRVSEDLYREWKARRVTDRDETEDRLLDRDEADATKDCKIFSWVEVDSEHVLTVSIGTARRKYPAGGK